jgi:hypothetical protein
MKCRQDGIGIREAGFQGSFESPHRGPDKALRSPKATRLIFLVGVVAFAVFCALPGIAAANQNPVAANDTWWTYQDQATTIPVAFLLSNDFDPDLDPLTLALQESTTTPTYSAYILGTDVIFEPEPGFVGTYYFSYLALDGQGGMGGAIVSVLVLTPQQVAPPPDGSSGPIALPHGSGTLELPPDAPANPVITVTSEVPTSSQAPPPGNFHIGAAAYYQITMDQPYTGTGTFKITLKYDDTGLTQTEEADLRLLHRKTDGSWEDVTWNDPSNPDTTNNLITGYTTSFSPFGVFLPSEAPVSTPAFSWQSIVVAALLGLGALFALERRRKNLT